MYRLLLADDDVEVRNGIAEFVGGMGLEVVHAETGLEALDLVRRHLIHLCLLDLNMPRCSGLEVLPIIRREQAELPCILYTANFTAEIERAAMNSGAFSVLRKPVRPELLRSEVQRALRLSA